MAQCFISTYRNSYRLYDDVELTRPIKSFNAHDSLHLPKEYEKEQRKDLNESQLAEETDALMLKYYQKRYWTSYQLHFCKDFIAKARGLQIDPADQSFENELMEYCKRLYERDPHHKVVAPISATRRLFGYVAPYRLRMPLTTYQRAEGKVGYDIMKRNAMLSELPPLEKTNIPNTAATRSANVVKCGCLPCD